MDNLYLRTYEAVKEFKSVRRAIRRGKVTEQGWIAPKRPFNNRGNSSTRGVHSRKENEFKKNMYGQIIEYTRRNN